LRGKKGYILRGKKGYILRGKKGGRGEGRGGRGEGYIWGDKRGVYFEGKK